MRRIRFYHQDGKINDEQELTPESLSEAIGMMARCYLRDGSCHEGFVCFSPEMDTEDRQRDYGSTFFLWTWAHLDENTHSLVGDGDSMYDQNFEPIDYTEVERVDAILFSNPRWGGGLRNHFFIETKLEQQ